MDAHQPNGVARVQADAAFDLHHAATALVVDTSADARELYSHWLAAAGMRVHQAIDGRDALAKVYSVRPQVVVADLHLPYIDGLQLCTLLRSDPATAPIRVVVISSNESAEHARRCHDRGADLVFVKPVAMEQLVAGASGLAVVVPDDEAPPAPEPVAPARKRPLPKAHAHERYMSTTPPQAPPRLRCPQCDAALQYERSHVGGVSNRHPEQWDYFTCLKHGTFQYRHRTRKLRAAS